MINQNLHRQPVALDSALHRQMTLGVPITDWSIAKELNAMFVAAVEFGEACREFPIVFIRAGTAEDGKPVEAGVEYAYCLVDYQCLFGEAKVSVPTQPPQG